MFLAVAMATYAAARAMNGHYARISHDIVFSLFWFVAETLQDDNFGCVGSFWTIETTNEREF